MINTITPYTINKLARQESTPSISIYLPMKPGFSGTESNRIVFKNALRSAKQMALGNFMPLEVKKDTKWVELARKMIDELLFWESQSKGLAIFINDEAIYKFRINHSFEQRIFVGVRFVVEPLSILEPETLHNHFILALSKKNTRLFRVRNDASVTRIAEKKIPEDLKKSLHLDEPGEDLQTHMVGLGGIKNSEAFHGHGGYKDRSKMLEDTFIRNVAKGVDRALGQSKIPLFVIGTAPLVAHYNRLNIYKPLMLSNIHQNVDRLDGLHIQKLLVA